MKPPRQTFALVELLQLLHEHLHFRGYPCLLLLLLLALLGGVVALRLQREGGREGRREGGKEGGEEGGRGGGRGEGRREGGRGGGREGGRGGGGRGCEQSLYLVNNLGIETSCARSVHPVGPKTFTLDSHCKFLIRGRRGDSYMYMYMYRHGSTGFLRTEAQRMQLAYINSVHA